MAPQQERPVAVIAGGSAGVGRAVAERLSDEGYDVAVLARGEERVRLAADDLAASGGAAIGLVCDVGDAEAVRYAAAQVMQRFGRIDVWVNSAMLTVIAPFSKVSAHEFDEVVRTTLMGTVHGTQAALEVMKRQGSSGRGHGNIVNIGSALAYRAIPLQSAYCSAKHAVNGFTQALRSELIHEGWDDIHLSLVQLPGINTPQFDWARNKLDAHPRPAPPVYQPEVAAEGVWKAIRTNAREIMVGRAATQLILGNMLAPAALDHVLASQGYSGQKDDREQGPIDGNLEAPVPGAWGAHGTFDDEAETSGVAIDGDTARGLFFGGSFLAAVSLGAVLGRLAAPSSKSRRRRRAVERVRRVARRPFRRERDAVGYEDGNAVKGLD